LTKRFQDGDLTKFEELIRKHQDRVYNLCRYMLRDPEDAQDAAQDVFLKAYRGIKEFTPEASFYTWLYRITVNTCLDYKRKARREALKKEPLPEDLSSTEPFAPELYESRENTEALQTALQKLPEKLRAAIVLREIDGLSYEEIADVLHASVGTVKSRISRAREDLRRILQRKVRQDLRKEV
jgi:RNA polymerase sigma-70 factor (ECF subfamily)